MKGPPPEEKSKDWRSRLREFAGALRNAPRAFALLWEADRASTIGLGTIIIVSSFLPVTQAWVTKVIIDSLLASIHAGLSAREGFRAVLPYLLLEFALILAGAVNGQVRALVEKLINHRLGHLVNTRIIQKALTLEARYFEEPEFYDKMQNARRQSEWRAMGLVHAGFLIVQNLLTLFSFLAVLVSFSPWIAGLLLGAAIPAFVVQCRYSALSFRLETWRTPETRNMTYLEQLLTQDTSVKEVKLFALGEPLLARYDGTFQKIFSEDSALAKSRSLKSLLWGLLATLSYYGAYGWVIFLTAGGLITLGGMTFYMTLFRQSQGTFQGLLENVNSLYENGLFLENLFGFLNIRSSVHVLKGRPAEDPRRGVEFRKVSFQYPGRENPALTDFSLTIGPAEKLALVGENGAGKTTLIKLLTRLYEPTGGEILFRGVDLRYYSIADLHTRIAVLFQDFVRYHLTLRENIGFGAIEEMADQERILAAARKGGADEVARELPRHYETLLGRWFDSGHELSGGEWQKVALARAFMSGRELLVLDEPTSSLDAASEFSVFQRFKSLTEGRMAILISHRFSTVRMADRIAVLKEGRLEELGSHSELMAKGGTYSTLFELQAQGYR